jgi:hypothetical protein
MVFPSSVDLITFLKCVRSNLISIEGRIRKNFRTSASISNSDKEFGGSKSFSLTSYEDESKN